MLSMPSTIRKLWLPNRMSRFVNEKRSTGIFGAPLFILQTIAIGSAAVLLQLPGKEFLRRAIRPDPALPHEEPMNLIGEHEFLDVHFLSAQALQQIDRLREIHIAIVIPLDEQHRRPPRRNRRIR